MLARLFSVTPVTPFAHFLPPPPGWRLPPSPSTPSSSKCRSTVTRTWSSSESFKRSFFSSTTRKSCPRTPFSDGTGRDTTPRYDSSTMQSSGRDRVGLLKGYCLKFQFWTKGFDIMSCLNEMLHIPQSEPVL